MKLLLIVLACVALLLLNKIKRTKHNNIAHLSAKDFKGEGTILVTDMTREELLSAIDGFIKIYTQDGDSYTRPTTRSTSQGFLLTFDGNVDYLTFCFWVNYLVYSNKEVKHNEHVTGWLKVGDIEDEKFKLFAHKTLMFFIPSSDTEYDNVYFTTSDQHCYKQEFANSQSLEEQESIIREYIPIVH